MGLTVLLLSTGLSSNVRAAGITDKSIHGVITVLQGGDLGTVLTGQGSGEAPSFDSSIQLSRLGLGAAADLSAQLKIAADSQAYVLLQQTDNAGFSLTGTTNGTGSIRFQTNSGVTLDLGVTGLQLDGAGARVDEFSTDGTLAGNSDTAIPTEKAIKTYVDANAGGGSGDVLAPISHSNDYIPTWDGVNTFQLSGGIANQSDNWNTAYGWGDHSAAGYLTSESDPVYLASDATGVTAAKIVNWDAAYTAVSGYGSAASRDAEDSLTNGANLPDGAAIIAYGTANWGGGGWWTKAGDDLNYATGNVAIGTSTHDRFFQVEYDSALTDTIHPLARLSHTTSGIPADDIGLGLEFEQETAAANNEVLATLEVEAVDVSSGAERGRVAIETMYDGDAAARRLQLTDVGLEVGGVVIALGGHSFQWNEAWVDRLKWDGGADSLVAATGRSSLGLGSAATRTAEDTLTDGSNLPDGAAIKAYGDANWAGETGYWSQTGDNVYYTTGIVGVNDTDFDGTPDVGRLTVKGTTDDGSTYPLVIRDSGGSNVAEVDSDGVITATTLASDPDSNPEVYFIDSDCTDSDKGVRIYSNATATGSGSEVYDWSISAMGAQGTAGTLEQSVTWDGSAQTLYVYGTLDPTTLSYKLDDLSAPDDNTDLNATTSKHGLLPKLDGATTKFLRGDGTWAAPSGAGDVVGPSSNTDGYIPTWDGSDTKTLANGIENRSSEWNTAYGWGNHASAGYLTAETDPVFGASEAASITSTDTSHWDTAYGWGNHASAGYITDPNDTVSGSELDGVFSSTGILVRTGVATYTTTTSTGYWLPSGSDIYYSDGNVGIGTSSPSYDLDVSGTVRSTGNITAGSGIILGGDLRTTWPSSSGFGDWETVSPSGSASTDVSNVQSAVNTGNPVYLEDGTFYFNSKITCNNAGQIIMGSGLGTVIQTTSGFSGIGWTRSSNKADSPGNGVFYVTASGVEIRDLKILFYQQYSCPTSRSQVTKNPPGITVFNVDRVRISNVRISKANYGIFLYQNCGGLWVDRLECSFFEHGITTYAADSDNRILDTCRFTNTHFFSFDMTTTTGTGKDCAVNYNQYALMCGDDLAYAGDTMPEDPDDAVVSIYLEGADDMRIENFFSLACLGVWFSSSWGVVENYRTERNSVKMDTHSSTNGQPRILGSDWEMVVGTNRRHQWIEQEGGLLTISSSRFKWSNDNGGPYLDLIKTSDKATTLISNSQFYVTRSDEALLSVTGSSYLTLMGNNFYVHGVTEYPIRIEDTYSRLIMHGCNFEYDASTWRGGNGSPYDMSGQKTLYIASDSGYHNITGNVFWEGTYSKPSFSNSVWANNSGD